MIPKFRAWDKNKQKMYTVDGFKKSERKLYRCSLADDEFRKGVMETFHFVEDNLDDFILMKSTGLKDKNGVEIFENDILRYSDKESFWIETVEFDKDRAQFISKQQGFEATSLDYIYNSKFITTEVIGNIYEHKHLLEEE